MYIIDKFGVTSFWFNSYYTFSFDVMKFSISKLHFGCVAFIKTHEKFFASCHMITASTIQIPSTSWFLLYRHTWEKHLCIFNFLSEVGIMFFFSTFIIFIPVVSLRVIWDFTLSASKITIFGLMSRFFTDYALRVRVTRKISLAWKTSFSSASTSKILFSSSSSSLIPLLGGTAGFIFLFIFCVFILYFSL